MKIVLAGSPLIAVKAFREVINNFDVIAIITQPDRPKNRGMKLESTPVAQLAKEFNIKLFKPEKVKNIYEELKALDFDLFLTFAYGQYIPENILGLGKFKPLNIHGSLLPKYRGAAPIHYAILNGDNELGISLIEMIKEMDAGKMFFKAWKHIDPETTTTGDGFKIIAKLAANNIVKWLMNYFTNDPIGIEQGERFSLSPKINKIDAQIKTTDKIFEVRRKILAFNPFPTTYTFIDGKRVKLYRFGLKKPGSLVLNLSDGQLFINEYKWEGKKLVKH